MITAPASCELCGCWLPSHSSACPRNGVHPSQWKFDISNEEQEEVSLLDEFE
ncbi:uncharacterized protein B0P05DRAFT_494404, partial [Gilbertella persicaria]|uniref:uncharacterized protein n=1 Tax=Gilbertella persicaria TaxID=101096 RepID=UPI00221EC954